MNNDCYEIKTVIFDNGIFDCTYVLLCCDFFPKREHNVMEQLNKLKPSKLVKIVYNI